MSNSTDGPPASWKSARIMPPSLPLAPPTLGAITFSCAPSFVAAASSAVTSFGSVPSATRQPTSRPFSVGLALARMLSIGDAARSVRAGTGVAAFAIGPS